MIKLSINLAKIKKIESEKRPPLIQKREDFPYAVNHSYGLAIRYQSSFPSTEYFLNQFNKEIELSEDSVDKIIKSLEEYKHGHYYSEDEVKAKLGIR